MSEPFPPKQPRQKLHQFLGLEEAFQVFHLPNASDDEDERLSDGPPENALVGALTGHAKPLLPVLSKTMLHHYNKPMADTGTMNPFNTYQEEKGHLVLTRS